jgi:hypothetical protein
VDSEFGEADQVQDAVEARAAGVVDFKRRARYEAAGGDGEQDGVAQGTVIIVERAVEEDASAGRT